VSSQAIPKVPGCSFELPSQLVEALLPITETVTSAKGAHIFQQGERCRGAYLVRVGLSQLTIHAENGREVLVRTAGPGCILGLPATLCGEPHSSTAVALEDSSLGFVDTAKFQDFIRSRPDLCIAIVQVMSRELAEMNARRANFSDCKACGCPLADTCAHHLQLP
jgi:CRP-like cAMP-binding protein